MCNSNIYFTLIGYKAFCLSVQRERERERAPVNRAFNCWHLVAGCLIGLFAVGIKIFCRKKDGDSNKEQAMPEGGGSVVSCCCSSRWVSEAHVPQPLLQLKVLWGREEDAFATQQDKPSAQAASSPARDKPELTKEIHGLMSFAPCLNKSVVH